MKLSKYNILKDYEDKTLFFNSISCAFAIVDDNFKKVVSDIENGVYNESKYDDKLIEQMKRTNAIIDNDFDETEYIRYARNLSKYDMTSLGLTIAPTLDCNFRCIYCFENHIHGVMNENVQNAVIDFIKARTQKLKNLSICWFGGEPLLSKSIIRNLSKKIMEICKECGIYYSASIISNASLIDDTVINDFKLFKIEDIQVTLDGTEKIHDARRKTVSGKSSFWKIVNNMKLLLENNITVSLRINIDNNNISFVDDLLKLLSNEPIFKERLVITFGKVSAVSEVCKSVEKECLTTEQYANSLIELYRQVLGYGFQKSLMVLYPKPHFNYCSYDYANSYVIDPRGSIYKCWNHIGQKEKSCGSIMNKTMIPSKNFMKCVNRDIILKECADCYFLPICAGGCPDEAAQQSKGHSCESVKYNFDNMLNFYYEQFKKKENGNKRKSNGEVQ